MRYSAVEPFARHLPLFGEVVEEWTPETLQIWRDGDLMTVPNPYGFIPYVIFPTSGCQRSRGARAISLTSCP